MSMYIYVLQTTLTSHQMGQKLSRFTHSHTTSYKRAGITHEVPKDML